MIETQNSHSIKSMDAFSVLVRAIELAQSRGVYTLSDVVQIVEAIRIVSEKLTTETKADGERPSGEAASATRTKDAKVSPLLKPCRSPLTCAICTSLRPSA
jgi:hypothetical protein